MDLKESEGRSARRHPWETSRARFFVDVLGRSHVLERVQSVLDVGAGDGYFAGELARRLPGAEVACLDANYTEAQIAAFSALRGAESSALRFLTAEPEGRFDLMLFLDVLEHVPDDVAFLSGLRERKLAPGGFVLVSVPAWQGLYTQHDVALGHYRRYRPAQLRQVLASSGLRPVAEGQAFHSLVLVRAFQKLGELLRGVRSGPTSSGFGVATESLGLGAWSGGEWTTRFVERCLMLDNGVPTGLQTAVPGLSIWALCESA
jgi:2-polyprenyl-3-methyl-5-hydroxy-6-metoxy-1,4-benzoquinol methylase